MVSSMLDLGQFPAGRAGWEPQPTGTVMDGVACSGTFRVLSHRLHWPQRAASSVDTQQHSAGNWVLSRTTQGLPWAYKQPWGLGMF